jgi:Mg2+ and Co2+ transporter CorA
MNTKRRIKDFFDSKQDNNQYVEKYEEHLKYFNDLLKNGHIEDVEFVISIKMYKYADPLNQIGKYKKALKVLSEIDNDLVRLKGQSKLYIQYLEGATFLKGVCLGRLKKYVESNKEFEKLLHKTHDNDRFIEWYKSNKKNHISNILDKISIFGVIFYLAILIADFMGYKIENLSIRVFGLILALIAFVTSNIWRRLIDKQKIKAEI